MSHRNRPTWRTRTMAAVAAGTLALGLGSASIAPSQAVEADAAIAPAIFPIAQQQTPDEELGAKPYLGWSSFSMQVFSGDGKWIDEGQLLAQSDAMHDKLQSVGFEYINVDAGWNGGTDEYGRPIPSDELYPSGLQSVIDHVHDNGQKFGLYLIPGLSPQVYADDLPIFGAPECSTGDIAKQPLQQADYWDLGYAIDFSNPCSQKYIDSIADLIAGWGVDFLKFDSVTPGSGIGDLSLDARDDVAAWDAALEEHDIWLELSWALDIRYVDYWKEHAEGWRVDWDVECYCEGESLTVWDNIARLFPRAAEWWRHAGPGGWNDFDSLNVGNAKVDGLTNDERRLATTFWAVSAVPMYIGNDMTTLDDYGIELLTNDEVIAVNQSGRPARPVSTETNRQTWYFMNPDGSVTVGLFNLSRTAADMTVNLTDLGLDGSAKVRDLWAKKDLGSVDSEFTATDVPIHGTRLLTFTPGKKSAITLNDDDILLGYEGDFDRNGGKEVASTTQPFAVTVGGAAENPAPPASNTRTLTVNNDDPSITYNGTWSRSSGRGLGDFQDDVEYAEANGSAFEYSFVGTGIDYVTETHESQGEVEIYLDGVLVETVNTHIDASEGRGVQQAVYSVRDLADGAHTLRAVKKSGQYMLVDKLDVIQMSLISTEGATFDPAAPGDIEVSLRDGSELAGISAGGTALVEGTDFSIDGDVITLSEAFLSTLAEGVNTLDFHFSGDFRDDVHSTATNGDSVSFAFEGTSVTWSSPLAPDQGEVGVYIDDTLVDTVDTRGDTRSTQSELFTSGVLKKAKHTLKLVKVSGDVMRVDKVTYAK